MESHIAFTIPTYTEDDWTYSKPEAGNYDYWLPLIEYYLTKADTIEIQCWNEESDTIQELESLEGNDVEIIRDEDITMFRWKKNVDFLQNPINRVGHFKWFTVNLLANEKTMFHSGHWGTEFLVSITSETEIMLIKNVVPPGTIFHK